MELDYDYIICGGGISGLLLALKFSNDSYYKDKSILILDPDFPKKSNDRTLCFWDKKILYGTVYLPQVGKMLFLKMEKMKNHLI